MKKDLVVVPQSLQEMVKWLPNSSFHEREVAFDHHSGRGIESYLIMGAILCKARDEEDWKKADCANFFEWVLNERKIPRTSAMKMIKVWDQFGPNLPKYSELIMKIPFENLHEVARIAHKVKDSEMDDLLHRAAVNTERDFRNNVKEIEGKVPTDNCDHINIKIITTTVEVCKRCGKALTKNTEEKDKEVK